MKKKIIPKCVSKETQKGRRNKMVDCLNCNNKKAHHIADGLYLCSVCEKKERFHLVRNIGTKEIYWKNINWCICDEELIQY